MGEDTQGAKLSFKWENKKGLPFISGSPFSILFFQTIH